MVEAEYAKALYELAIEEKKVDLFWDYFIAIDKTNDDPDFKKIMSSPIIDNKEKKEIIKKVYYKLDETFLNFLYVLTDHNHFNLCDKIGHEYRKLVRLDKNIMFIDVISANDLTKAQEDKIVKVLKTKYSDKTLQFKYIVKPDLLGGIQIISNGVSIDMSLKSALDRIKEEL
ncbi:MAG: ATP synthase F1 subunit delta [Acholeplasmatales bacterium]|nr:ATP synthase F1 subunit delta [Acholeplasmatales bacterium]